MPTHLTLAIETSNPSAVTPAGGGVAGPGIALGRVTPGQPGRVEVIADRPVTADRGRHDDALMPAVADLCAGAGVEPRQIEQLAVSVGPGGFTSVRIAVAAVKMIALATGARVVGVPSAMSVRHATPVDAGGPVGVGLASKRDSVHLTVFEDSPTAERWPTQADRLVRADDPVLGTLAVLIADAFLPPAVAERCAALGVPVVRPVFDARACLALSAVLDPTPPARLAVVYPREPEAVRKWAERGA